jgi:bisphosphoglycerate-independent phosphoglycerate mutase (AlkP superfamily)
VLFANLPLDAGGATLTDLAPTVLALFGVRAPEYMQGRSLLRREGERS